MGRVFRSHLYKNVHVEVLYQRYFLRMNQSNLISLLALLITTALVFCVLNYAFGGDQGFIQAIIMGLFALLYFGLELLVTRCIVVVIIFYIYFAIYLRSINIILICNL